MKKILRCCGLAALLAGAAFYLPGCDEEVRQPYGGPWRIVKTPPEVEAPIMDIFFLDANTGWASAYKILLKWNGKEWLIQKKFTHPVPEADYSIKPIWAFAEDDIWVAGGEGYSRTEFHSKIWHFNGTYWEDVKHPDVGGISYLWFNSPDDGWAMGGDYMLRWDGIKWELTYWESSATTGVWFNAPDDGWRTTFSFIYHWDGVMWTREAERGPWDCFSSIGFSGPRSGWAGLYAEWTGGPSLMFHYESGRWDYYDHIFNQDIWDIDFYDSNYGCAVGNGAHIYEGGSWITTHDPRAILWCVECVGPNDVWAGAGAGDIYHFTGLN